MGEREMFVWVEKYRPQVLADCVLPTMAAQSFADIIARGDTTNLLLTGKAGTGKTTAALVLARAFDAEVLFINASSENGINTARTSIPQFASAASMDNKRKLVILDEADSMTSGMQQAMRALIEEFAGTCGFIFTCNVPNKIIDPLHSRCSVVNFNIPTNERPTLMASFMKRMMFVLDAEGVTYDKKILAGVVSLFFPDFRRTLNELQRFSMSGTLSESILSQLSDKDVVELFGLLKAGEYSAVCKWVKQRPDMDAESFFAVMYEQLPKRIADESLTGAVIAVADYAFRSGQTASAQLNTLACLTELMNGTRFK